MAVFPEVRLSIMPNIERLFRQGLDVIAQQLGLRPKHSPTKDDAIDEAIERFLNGKTPGQILELPPEDTGKDPLDPVEKG